MRDYIGKLVRVVIDRPLGTSHPDYPDTVYAVNYGYVPRTVSGDGEELDCYVLGINTPVYEYTGRCIAVIHRLDGDDDKLIIAPDGRELSDGDIEALTDFQERYFSHTILR